MTDASTPRVAAAAATQPHRSRALVATWWCLGLLAAYGLFGQRGADALQHRVLLAGGVEGSLFDAPAVDLRPVPPGAAVTALSLTLNPQLAGQPVQRCIEVGATGASSQVRLSGRGASTASRLVTATVEVGGGGDGGGCDGFDAERSLFAGSLAELAAHHGTFTDGLDVGGGAGGPLVVRILIDATGAPADALTGRTYWFDLEARESEDAPAHVVSDTT